MFYWDASEVIAYLEEKLKDGIATYKEEVYYQTYSYNGELKNNNTYRGLVKQMNTYYQGGF